MDKKDSVIDDNWSFRISISWWEILLTIAAIALLVYLIRKKRKKVDGQLITPMKTFWKVIIITLIILVIAIIAIFIFSFYIFLHGPG